MLQMSGPLRPFVAFWLLYIIPLDQVWQTMAVMGDVFSCKWSPSILHEMNGTETMWLY